MAGISIGRWVWSCCVSWVLSILLPEDVIVFIKWKYLAVSNDLYICCSWSMACWGMRSHNAAVEASSVVPSLAWASISMARECSVRASPPCIDFWIVGCPDIFFSWTQSICALHEERYVLLLWLLVLKPRGTSCKCICSHGVMPLNNLPKC
jgi:hypothetical protein